MANSIQQLNTNVVNLLADAGADGLHEDDMVQLLGFKEKKHLSFRLRDLKGRNQITDLPGGRWKKVEPKTIQPTTGDARVTPSSGTTEELPSILLPGTDKFTSYKNSLQSYCQKKHMPLPQYKVDREGGGFIGKVTFGSVHVRSEGVAPSLKDAEARVAYDALRKMGYMKDSSNQFNANSHLLKRKEAMGLDYAETTGKKAKKERQDGTPKSMLNEYAQKNQKNLPTYEIEGTADSGFIATVKIDGKEYKGESKTKQRDAQQSAASIALKLLSGKPLSTTADADSIREVAGNPLAL